MVKGAKGAGGLKDILAIRKDTREEQRNIRQQAEYESKYTFDFAGKNYKVNTQAKKALEDATTKAIGSNEVIRDLQAHTGQLKGGDLAKALVNTITLGFGPGKASRTRFETIDKLKQNLKLQGRIEHTGGQGISLVEHAMMNDYFNKTGVGFLANFKTFIKKVRGSEDALYLLLQKRQLQLLSSAFTARGIHKGYRNRKDFLRDLAKEYLKVKDPARLALLTTEGSLAVNFSNSPLYRQLKEQVKSSLAGGENYDLNPNQLQQLKQQVQ